MRRKSSLLMSLAILALGACAAPVLAQRDGWTWVNRYHFKIDANAPIESLLPTPPKMDSASKLLRSDLAEVAEMQFAEPYVFEEEPLDAARRRALVHIAHQVAKVNAVNQKKQDCFMECLLKHRPDLQGLPFTLGGACRLNDIDRTWFETEVRQLRSQLDVLHVDAGRDKKPTDRVESFWSTYDKKRLLKLFTENRASDESLTTADRAAIAALLQMLGAESAQVQSGLVKRLDHFNQTEDLAKCSAHALARLAVFAQDAKTRQAAIDVLKNRSSTESVTMVLLQGIRYPWPAIAQNAADAIVRLKRTDLAGELVRLLDEADPRAPVKIRETFVVRELVRINHHRNCLLCHPPGNTPEIFGKVRAKEVPPNVEGIKGVTAENVGLEKLNVDALHGMMPVPGVPFPSASEYYNRFATPDILVRADTTYLRQDFSVMQKVANFAPWPERQRFDFVVRKRVLTAAQAERYRREFTAGASPYRTMALAALQRLTGRNAGATASEWRAALNGSANVKELPR